MPLAGEETLHASLSPGPDCPGDGGVAGHPQTGKKQFGRPDLALRGPFAHPGLNCITLVIKLVNITY